MKKNVLFIVIDSVTNDILFNKNKVLLVKGTVKSNINLDINDSRKRINFKNINFEIKSSEAAKYWL